MSECLVTLVCDKRLPDLRFSTVNCRAIADLLQVSVEKCHAVVILFCARFHCRINSETSVEQILHVA